MTVGQAFNHGRLILASNAASAHYNPLCTPAAIDFEKGDVKAPGEVPPVPGKA